MIFGIGHKQGGRCSHTLDIHLHFIKNLTPLLRDER
jgi:hypothetical protein